MFFVDSSKRDRSYYPTPSEYVVDFDEPIKYVFGMDVMDATIPGTMYNVDVINNTLVALTVDSAKSAIVKAAHDGAIGGNTEELYVSSENRVRDVLCDELYALGFSADFNSWLHDRLNRRIIMLPDETFDANLPPQDATGAAAVADGNAGGVHHSILIRHVIRGIPMFAPRGSVQAPGSFLFKGKTFAVASPTSPQNAALVHWIAHAETPFALVPSRTAAADSLFDGCTTTTTMYDIVYYRAVAVTAEAYDAALATLAPTGSILLKFDVHVIRLEVGNYVTSTLLLHVQTKLLNAFGLSVVSTSDSTVDKQGMLRFEGSMETRFLFCVEASTCGATLGFDLYADVSQNLQPPSRRKYNAVPYGDSKRPMFMSVMRYDANKQNTSQLIDAPGVVNLLGVRYITLRCREIEEHMGSIGKYSSRSTGIGVFKLANANEVAQLRFDFVSLIRKPFHPVGRMTRMTLRFEMNTGELYDFKGINHQLLIMIKYYVPFKKIGSNHIVSVLNPDYDPDFMQYMLRQQKDQARAVDEPGYPDEDEEDAEPEDAMDDAAKRMLLLAQYKNDFLEKDDEV